MKSWQLVNASSATGLYFDQLWDELDQASLLKEDDRLFRDSAGMMLMPQEIWTRITSGYLFGRLACRDHICERLLWENGKSAVTRETVNWYRRKCDDFAIRSGDLYKTVATSLDNRLNELFRQRRESINRNTQNLQCQSKVSAGDLF